LSTPAIALDRDRDGEILERGRHDARRDHAGDEVLRKRDPHAAAMCMPWKIDRRSQQHDREEQREDEACRGPEELLEFDAAWARARSISVLRSS
jgi:hypothetical protein